jgi:hypothetical protein
MPVPTSHWIWFGVGGWEEHNLSRRRSLSEAVAISKRGLTDEVCLLMALLGARERTLIAEGDQGGLLYLLYYSVLYNTIKLCK